MRIVDRMPSGIRVCAVSLALCAAGSALGDPPSGTGAAAPAAAPTGSFFSSISQAFKQDLNYAVVRGHFDVGTAPDSHRFYCLVDTKSGKDEANAVTGEPYLRPDGMTGIKSGAVSPLNCAKAEAEGILMTTEYVVNVGARNARSAPTPVPAESAPAAAAAAAPPATAPRQSADLARKASPTDKADVAGVRLGMAVDQVRAILKSKGLADYYESTSTLSSESANGRFVNTIVAWTPLTSTASGDGESFEIMFTPVPGKERVLAIVHSTAYSGTNAVRALALDNGLVAKYGGYSSPDELPAAPTWRVQSGGNVLTGDPCNRRGVVGGLAEINSGAPARENLALKTTVQEFQYQVDHCGAAIVTEDQVTPNGDAPLADRTITRFTVTAYSPSIGLEGATTAAQLIQAQAGKAARPRATIAGDSTTPSL